MTNEVGKPSNISFSPDLEWIADDIRWVSLTFGLSFYTDIPFSKIPKGVLSTYDKYLAMCPDETLKFYATENMRRHKEVTPKVLNMLRTWLKPGAPARQYMMIELKDGPTYNSAPKYKFEIWGNEEGSPGFATKDANLLRMTFPPELALKQSEEMLSLAKEVCKIFPLQSGLAGFSYECSQYKQRDSQSYAWAKSMRHRGIDISAPPNDKMTVRHDGVKGVGWLTMICQPFVEQIGGMQKIRKSLPSDVEILSVGNVVLLKAGLKPEIGDTNSRDFLPSYKAVHKVVKPLVEMTFNRSPALMAGEIPDFEVNTQTWRRRFDDG